MADDTTTHDDDSATATSTKRTPWQRLRGSGGDGSAQDGSGGHTMNAVKLRALLAQLLFTICVVLALILAVAVLLIAVDANPKNDLVLWVIHRADNVDLGFFDLSNPIKDFDLKKKDPAQDVKTALFNYGIAAIVWLALGKFLDKVVRA